jgi:hypothetical protein
MLEPAGKERLAGAVLAADRLERAASPDRSFEIEVDPPDVPLDADGEQLQPSTRNRPATKGIDHFSALDEAGLGHGTGPMICHPGAG